MPLPDERPRPNVANLIGKFETQSKRLSVSASSPSRSSSVVSHTTGESAKEEPKEKREWPPKSVTESSIRPSHIVSSFSPRPPLPPPLTTTTSSGKTDGSVALDLEVPLTAKALNSSQMQAKADPEAFLENWRKDLPPETAMESTEEPPATAKPTVQEPANPVTPTPSGTKKLASAVPPRTPKASITKAAPAPKATTTTSKPPVLSTPAKPATVKAPVRTAAAKPTLAATPLKPQHTGQSAVSATGTRKPVIKTSAPPKTPSRSETATRAKTPLTSSRPKTPSSGLFAPTAASLARSRNAAPAVPTPVKKATLSTSAMDRLSKPTAASQARMATAAAPPPSSFRPTPASAARAAAGSTGKQKPSVAATPRKDPVKRDRVPSRQEAKPAETPSAVVEPESVAAASAVSLASSTTLSTSDDVQENASEDVFGEEENLAAPPEHFDEPEGPADNDVTPRSPSPPPRADVIVSLEAETGAETPVESESAKESDDEHAAVTENGNGGATHKDDLEDIVNLLESTSIAQRGANHTTENIPEEMSEIPDEEDK